MTCLEIISRRCIVVNLPHGIRNIICRFHRHWVNAVMLVSILWLAASSLNAQMLDHGVYATNLGKGDWIYKMPASESALGVSNAQALVNYEAAKGMQWIAVKGADGGNTNYWTQFNPMLVSQAHAAGLKIFAWGYVYGNNGISNSVPGEINAALTLLGEGADGFIIDAEIEYETNTTRYADAAAYCRAIKAAYPNTFLAHMPDPYISAHTNFPYAVFGYYCDAVMPQDYWAVTPISPAQMVSDMDAQWKAWANNLTGTNVNAIKPLAPIGQGYDLPNPTPYTETAADITNFIYLLKTDANPASPGGYNGVSFWSCQYHTAADWAGIAASSIGTPATVVSAPQIMSCQLSGGQLTLDLRGAAGSSFTIYSSTDLVHWTTVTNLANPTGTNQFKDKILTNTTQKFYRAALTY